MKKIAISQGVSVLPERKESRDYIDQKLVSFIQNLDYHPVLVPNSFFCNNMKDAKNRIINWLMAMEIGGIVLSGGNDVGTCIERDNTERVLLDFAINQEIPLLGICRGMQFLGIEFGGILEKVEGHVDSRHVIDGLSSRKVNSFHQFGFLECPNEFRVLMRSKDKVLEAIRHKTRDFEGWMWHPEREKHFDELDLNNFKELFK